MLFKKYYYNCLRIFLILVVSFSATQIFAESLPGWNSRQGSNTLIYTPSKIDSNKTFRITVFAPVKSKNIPIKKITVESAKALQKLLGKPLKEWQVTKNSNSYSVTNTFKNSQGKKLFVSYMGIPSQKGDFYLIQTVSSLDKKLEKLMKETPALFRHARQTYNPHTPKKQNVSHTKNNKQTKKARSIKKDKHYYAKRKKKFKKIQKAIRTAPGDGAKLSDIEVILANIQFNGLVGSIIVETSVLFKDGSIYLNCKIPPTELNVQKSKQLEVAGDVFKRGKWSKWRKNGSSYEFKSLRTGAWKEVGGTRALSGKKNETVNLKYSAAGGSQLRGSWKKKILLKSNGRFEMSSFSIKDNSMLGGGDTTPFISTVRTSDKRGSRGSTVVSGDYDSSRGTGVDIGGGATVRKNNGSKNTGTYTFGDYHITLKHDNGWEHTELFFFDKADRTAFVYQDERFWTGK